MKMGTLINAPITKEDDLILVPPVSTNEIALKGNEPDYTLLTGAKEAKAPKDFSSATQKVSTDDITHSSPRPRHPGTLYGMATGLVVMIAFVIVAILVLIHHLGKEQVTMDASTDLQVVSKALQSASSCLDPNGTCAWDYSTLVNAASSTTSGEAITICGDLYLEDTVTIDLKDVTICCVDGARCSLTSLYGNRNLVVQGENARLQGLTLMGGGSSDGNGGNVLVRSSGHVEIFSCAFLDGYAGALGGNVHVQNAASLRISNSIFKNGTAFFGGGLGVQNVFNLSITGSHFISNRGGREGGGVLHFANRNVDDAHHVHLSLNRFDSNSAERGGAFYMRNLGDDLTLHVSDSFFKDNSAAVQGGVGFVLQNSTLDLELIENLAVNSSAVMGTCPGMFLIPNPNTGRGNECLDISEPMP